MNASCITTAGATKKAPTPKPITAPARTPRRCARYRTQAMPTARSSAASVASRNIPALGSRSSARRRMPAAHESANSGREYHKKPNACWATRATSMASQFTFMEPPVSRGAE
jgi:hypothetical protein